MSDPESDSARFEAVSRELLKRGLGVRFEARGASMSPCIRDGEIVYVTGVMVGKLRKGDIVLVKSKDGFRVHRLVVAEASKDWFVTRGDCGQQDDPPVRGDQILGVVDAKEVKLGKKLVRANLKGIGGRLLRGAARGQYLFTKLWHRVSSGSRRNSSGSGTSLLSLLPLLFVVLAVAHSTAQVAVDATTTNNGDIPGPGTFTGTLNHTTGTGANRLLLVGVSININNSANTKITAINYNGTALTLLGTHNDAGNTRRVEIWYLLNPASGTNVPISVSINVPTAATVGAVVGATTFTGVDQTVPLSALVSADGAAGGNSQLDVPSVINGMVFDTLATGSNQTITIPGPQVQQWNLTSGNIGATTDVAASASTRSGAPSVPISESFSGTSNWSVGAVSINPSTADIGVSTSVGSAVFLGSNTTYTVTVSNNGPSAANNVVLTDAWSDTGLTLVSVTPSAGTTCTSASPIVCTLPTPLASGATATIAITVTASASGAYPNTATVSDSGTPPDPNTGNNTYVAVATVQSAACAAVSQAAPGTNLTGVLNTYYPGTGNVAAGATSIPVGAATGAGSAIAAGNLLLVIQMQNASINDSNNVDYGNGGTGQGFTALNSAGDYEFVTAQSAVGTAGGSVTISGAGAGGGLVFSYHSAAASATAGQSTYQVIVVPQYTTASFSATSPPTALAWNGSTGGVLSLDMSNTLTLNGATVAVDGLGFRGGAGLQLEGGVGGSNTDYLHAAPAAYTGAVENGVDAVKGEGIAGTPLWVESANSYLKTSSDYPSGTAGTDGSSARGAPGNAGGGGTDADPAANDENSGGGGGGNGGAGGFGGDSWNSNLSVGGEGGTAFPATINRVAMGGGGGAGTRNNSDGDNRASSGASGGGIIIVRTYALSGSGTFTANGISAYNGTSNDAGGGGGAGGTIVVLSANGGESGLTLQANGGTGGDAWASQAYSLGNRHGPGGGGGGGVILVSGAPAGLSVAGGANGLTLNPGVAYGSTSGASGTSVTNAAISQTSGTLSGAQCTPDVTLAKSHVGTFVRGSTATYTIPVSNVSQYGPTNGIVTMNDTLPLGLTPTSASGTGWSCSIASQTVSCTDATVLAATSSYPSITINANILQTAPSVETNTATVGGGGEVNLANDSATDVANVTSSADLSVTNTASPDPVAAGSNVTYAQVVTNNGPSAADNATLSEAIPANTTFVSLMAPASWSCNTPAVGGTGNVVCTDLSLNGGTAATFSLVAKVTAGTANGTVITNVASVSSSASDPNTSNNTAVASTIVGSSAGAELLVTNAASPDPVVAGNNITYTQVVSNVGSAAATAATFSEATPANTTFVSVSAPSGWTCTSPPVSCTNPSVAAGATGTFTVIDKVNGGTAAGTVISDTATAASGTQSNSATATDIVAASASQADLALTTSSTPSYVFAGNDITYIQTITNNGPATATGISFLEAVPANTTFSSISPPAGWTCTTPAVGATGNITCTDASLTSGDSINILVAVNVASSITATPITANSSVSATTSDPYLSNNSTAVTTPVSTICDLAVTNSGTPSPVTAGSNITYTQIVTNAGPSNCGTATFTEAIPANTTLVSLPTPSGWTCTTSGSISCTNPSVAPGTTSTFTLTVQVGAATAQNTAITDTATVGTATHDSNSSNNSATVIIGVAGATQADLSVTNSASPNPVSAGSNITYTQTVTNNGPATAGGTVVALFDQVPSNTTYVSQTGPAGWTCGTFSGGFYTCSIASLAAHASATFTFVVNVSPTVSSGTTISDTDSVSAAPTTDPNSNNNNASASVIVASSADLSVTNSASPVPVQAGNNITYTQVVTNAGPSTATNASFTETVPTNTTFVSLTPIPAGWACVLGATITCTNPSFASGSVTFPVVVSVNAGTAAGTAIADTASITSSTTDPNSANNSATANDVVATSTQSDLVTTNVATPLSVAAGSNITYAQSVTNLGPAQATGATFTQSTPPNTNFQSITPPAGWTCTKPAVGGTGTITCTDASALALNAPANFSLVLQVNANTASGTTINETATSTATNVVPNLTNSTASAAVTVSGSGSTSLAITKSATPNPTVPSGDPLLYTLGVTNNGPNTANNVTVTDPLPADVTYYQVVTTLGTCSEAGGTVTCLLGTLASGSSATIYILTLAGAPGIATNTATVSATGQTSASASQTETITAATSVKLKWFTALRGTDKTGASRVILLWKTGEEAHNIGFNVYREQGGERVQLNSSLIAGSALLMRGALPKHSGKTYAWIDSSPDAGSSSYWLEDVDINGTRTLHGPVLATDSDGPELASGEPSQASTLNQLNRSQTTPAPSELSHRVERVPTTNQNGLPQRLKQFELAAHAAVKMSVQHEGWYCATQLQLVQAGLDASVDPALLHLYAEAVEQPMQVSGATAGRGGFGPQASICFYGTGIDTQYSGTRIYWLVAGESQGERMQQLPASIGSNQPPASFPFSIELTPHTTYFSALTTAHGNNFFGPLVSSTPLIETLLVPHLDSVSTESAQLEVILQGIILAAPHDVTVALNGTMLGDLTFIGQDKGRFTVSVPPGILQNGTNDVTLTSQDGEYDYSLVQSIRINYPHLYMADSDQLVLTGHAGEELNIAGFSQSAISVLDITDPANPIQLTPQVSTEAGYGTTRYAAQVQVPWSAAGAGGARHTLLAFANDRIASPAEIRRNHPSQWHSAQPGSEVVMVSADAFAAALSPIVRAHQAEGKSSAVVLVDDLYDEFTFGQHNPYAIRDFLQTAVKVWRTAPKYLLLNGRASLDPRNYLGFGDLDFVPTKLIPSTQLMTASDDWFSDFNDSGMPTIATGRFPVSTAAEAALVTGKVATYEGQSTDGPWTSEALMVADVNDTENFTKDSQIVQAQLPSGLQVTDVFATTMGVSGARQAIFDDINSGQLFVNYTGHGSEEEWSGNDLFDNDSANALTNGSALPVFFIMDCLNGFFQDVYEEPLGVTLMLAPNGGAVAVLASSGLNQAAPQIILDKYAVQAALGAPHMALGYAILKAKSGITDNAVRQTYILFGDPAMQIKLPGASTSP